jgi:ABC-type antimicrobial peptide transport system ATPase subunit
METENKGGNTKELPREMQKILKSIDFPVSKKDLIEQEKKSEAIPDILRELGMLPDKKYNSAEDVAEEIQKIYSGIPA